jgi:uncharacterized protein involved in response to NO
MKANALPPVLQYAFRPMFLAAGAWAVVALALWLATLITNLRLPTRFDPISWHIHEMLFGFVMAAVAGFLLTAIPNWTGRRPVRGAGLAALVALWLLGRLACLVSAELPAWLAIAIDLAFPVTLLAVATREIVAGKNWRNLVMTVPLTVFVIANLAMHLQSLNVQVLPGVGWRLGMAAPIILIGIIGGRITPSFTRNWLVKRNSLRLPASANRFDTACACVLALALILWGFAPVHPFAGALLIAAALLNAARACRWAGFASWPEKLVFILHVGYAWVDIGVALLGLSIFGLVTTSSAIHALTAGAIAVTILAVMPRVTLGHTGRALVASGATVTIFALINAAAVVRVASSWYGTPTVTWLIVAGALWIAAFGLFETVYGPMLLKARADS